MGGWLGLKALKTLYFHLCKLIKKNCRILEKNFARNYEKNNTWNIRRLVDDSMNPASQGIILNILGFMVCIENWNSKYQCQM